jgi:hypothetical protein
MLLILLEKGRDLYMSIRQRAILTLILSLLFLILSTVVESHGLTLYDLYLKRDGEDLYLSDEEGIGACLHIFLLNSSEQVINIEELYLGGESITSLINQRRVFWYDINPVRVMPGEISCIKVRLFRYIDYEWLNELQVSATTDNGSSTKITFQLPEGKKNLHFSYVGYKEDKVYIYFTSTQQEGPMGKIQKVLIDNVDVSENIEKQYQITSNHGLVILKLSVPPAIGDYHTLTLIPVKGDRISYQVRVIESRFPVAMDGMFSSSYLDSYAQHQQTPLQVELQRLYHLVSKPEAP